MRGNAYIFINLVQAARLGHVAWGFTLDESDNPDCYFGSTDHLIRHAAWDIGGWLRYAHLPPGHDNDWWEATEKMPAMIESMRSGHHIRYHVVKVVPVANAQPDKAVKQAQSLSRGGWSVLANNCVHQTYQVLTAYGASLSPPIAPPLNLIPRVWFNSIAATPITIRQAQRGRL